MGVSHKLVCRSRRLRAWTALLLLTASGCRSTWAPAPGVTYRGVSSNDGASVETVLAPMGAGWLLYRVSGDSVQYAVLDVQGRPRDTVLTAMGATVGVGIAERGILTVRVVDNPITQRPLVGANVDALAGPRADAVSNVAGAKADSQGIARIPRRWEEFRANEAPQSIAADTAPIRFVGRIRGRDTVIVITRSQIRSSSTGVQPGPAHWLQVTWHRRTRDIALDTALLPRDLSVSLGLGLTRASSPLALRRRGLALALTWTGQRQLLRPSRLPPPAWCRW